MMIVLVVVAGLSVYSLTVMSSLSKQNSSLSREVSGLSQEVSSYNNILSAIQARAVRSAIDYLVSNYDQHVGLIPVTPHSDVYWLYSDNYLANLSLHQAGFSNKTVMNVTDNISTTLKRYSKDINNAQNQYMVIGNDWKGACSFNATMDYTVQNTSGVKIMVTLNNGTGTLSESKYADIAFLSAICNLNRHNYDGWSKGFGLGTNLSNAIGFNDAAFREGSSKGIYQTYKLALLVYADRDQCGPFNQTAYDDALGTLLATQAPNGGFYTGYNYNYSINGTTNVETTSLTLLALTESGFCMEQFPS